MVPAMPLRWIKEQPPYWDRDKAEILGNAPSGTFEPRWVQHRAGDLLGGDWWRVEADGEVLGYGWMDVSWGDAEILLAVAPAARNRGVGSFILRQLESEARMRGINYIHNVVQPEHPEGRAVEAWLEGRQFARLDDGRLLRAIVQPQPDATARA